MNNSIYIILNQYKNGHITDEEAVQLIEDLYKNRNTYIPVFPSWSQTTWSPKEWQVTCSYDTK